METFKAIIYKIGVNPYVFPPPGVLKALFTKAGKDRGPVPVRLIINKVSFAQTLVKYSGEWRLYLNGPMRKAAGKDVGDEITISIEHDTQARITSVPVRLQQALQKNKKAKEKFEQLPPSRQKEISRYIGNLKSEAAVEKNVQRAINFLLEKERFIGRDKP